MAKSADAADLKSAGRKAVGVQVPLRAPINSITYTFLPLPKYPRLWSNCGRTRKVVLELGRNSTRTRDLGHNVFTPSVEVAIRCVSGNDCAKPTNLQTGLPDTRWSALRERLRKTISRNHWGFSHRHVHTPRQLPFQRQRRFDREIDSRHHPIRSNFYLVTSDHISRQEEETVMATMPALTRRLLKTKQAAAYLSLSEWKLRRLIQDAILPVVQNAGGGPFLLDVRDLDAYIENNKRHLDDALDWRPKPVAVAVIPSPVAALRRAR